MSVRAAPDAISPVADRPERIGDPAAVNFRGRRRASVAEVRRRRDVLISEAPEADLQFVNAIAASDSFWGPDERWRAALSHHVVPASPGGSDGSSEPTGHQAASTSQSNTHPAGPHGFGRFEDVCCPGHVAP
jgi:hypothetical protein